MAETKTRKNNQNEVIENMEDMNENIEKKVEIENATFGMDNIMVEISDEDLIEQENSVKESHSNETIEKAIENVSEELENTINSIKEQEKEILNKIEETPEKAEELVMNEIKRVDEQIKKTSEQIEKLEKKVKTNNNLYNTYAWNGWGVKY